MNARPLITAFALVALLSVPGAAPAEADPAIGGPLLKTDVFADAGAFAHATTERARFDERLGGFRLVDDPASSGYASSGSFMLPALHYGAGFNRVVPSWNADCPPGTFVAIELAASPDSGKTWTKWLQVARWGDTAAIKAASNEAVDKVDDVAKINEDTFEIKQGKADRLRMRVTLRSDRPATTPVVTLVGLAVADKTQAAVPDDSRSAAWGKEVQTDFRSQGWEQPDMSYRICGPTSTTMMLTAHGIKLPTADVARTCWDDANGIYGNWPFIAAGASDLMRRNADAIPAKAGKRKAFRSWVSWAPDWKQVEQEVAAGNPVVVSIRFKPGELKNAPIASTAGHLILVKGFTKDGDPIAHDPAAKNASKGRIIYNRQELHRARHGGPVILFHPYE